MISCSFQLAENKVEIWAFNMFKVDYTLIFTVSYRQTEILEYINSRYILQVISSISTYLFLMLQFELDSNNHSMETILKEWKLQYISKEASYFYIT